MTTPIVPPVPPAPPTDLEIGVVRAALEADYEVLEELGRGGMAVKPVVCRAVEDAKGKSGQELADAIEHVVMQFHRSNYRLSALMPGDPPIACFFSLSDPSKLPMGAK